MARGSIIKRGDTYSVVVEMSRDPLTGKRRRAWKSGFRTRKDAEKARTEMLGRLDTGSFVESSGRTVRSFLESEWLPGMESKLKRSTFESYEQIVAAYIVPRIGARRLQELTPADVNGMYADLLKRGARGGRPLAAKSVRNTHVVLRKALGDALKWGMVTTNAAERADPPKSKAKASTSMQTWTPAEARRFLDSTASDSLAAVYALALQTGMRRGEILGLRWQDVDLDAGRLAVRQTLLSVGYEVTFSTPKTHSARNIPLAPTVVTMLREHQRAQLEQRLRVGLGGRSELVFTEADGSPLHPDQVSSRFRRLVAAAGVPEIRFHDLRHTWATLALQAGIPTKVVSEVLGHASIVITLDTYSHAIPSMMEDATARVSALLEG